MFHLVPTLSYARTQISNTMYMQQEEISIHPFCYGICHPKKKTATISASVG